VLAFSKNIGRLKEEKKERKKKEKEEEKR